ncbi:MAG TPA: nicotinate phosphoribosyltransferase [Steroidobacteraceae bacterium]|nr:nicotinate phosphoribosyltransferase [Steroidobacteraceae bacterium]
MSTPFVPVIRSLLDTDLYKFTMWQAMLHQFPGNDATYEFHCRNRPTLIPLSSIAGEVDQQIDHLCSLGFSEEELAYLGTLRYLKRDFIEFLRIFRFQRHNIRVATDGEQLRISVSGSQIHVMCFEIFVLSIVNELYFRRITEPGPALDEGRRRLNGKIAYLKRPAQHPRANRFVFFEFGTRRRFSKAWQEEVCRTLMREAPDHFRGTSNVDLAHRLGVTAMGTMAHEYLQTYQAVGVQLRFFQKAALEGWVQEYRGDLGIALTDVIGMDAFLNDFDLYFAKLFDGLRHDSGDPIVWGEKALAHYARLRIPAASKRLVFSDGLTIPKAVEIYDHFADRIPCGFGIGTHLTNDMGLDPLNIVLKLTTCNGQSVAKLSDSPGKTLCDDETFLAYLRQVFSR